MASGGSGTTILLNIAGRLDEPSRGHVVTTGDAAVFTVQIDLDTPDLTLRRGVSDRAEISAGG